MQNGPKNVTAKIKRYQMKISGYLCEIACKMFMIQKKTEVALAKYYDFIHRLLTQNSTETHSRRCFEDLTSLKALLV